MLELIVGMAMLFLLIVIAGTILASVKMLWPGIIRPVVELMAMPFVFLWFAVVGIPKSVKKEQK
jgi:ATP/ADP translocase